MQNKLKPAEPRPEHAAPRQDAAAGKEQREQERACRELSDVRASLYRVRYLAWKLGPGRK